MIKRKQIPENAVEFAAVTDLRREMVIGFFILLPDFIPMPYNLAAVIIFWMMTILAMGDIANVRHVLKEVPKGAKVFNYGLLRSFYLQENQS